MSDIKKKAHETGLSSSDSDPERASFERWFVKTQTANNYRRIAKAETTGVYLDRVTRIAWHAWKASQQHCRNTND